MPPERGRKLPVSVNFPTDRESYVDDVELTDRNDPNAIIFRIYRATVSHQKGTTGKPNTVVKKVFDLERTNPSSNADTLTDVQKEVAVMRGGNFQKSACC